MIRDNLVIPHFLISQKKERRGFPSYYKLFACDTETYYNPETKRQEIFTIQFTHKVNGEIKDVIIPTSPETALDDFLNFLEKNTAKKKPHYIFFHYLYYDLVSIFFYHSNLSRAFANNVFSYEYNGYKIKVTYGKGNFITIRKDGTQYTLMDSFAFFKSSLANLCDVLDLPFKKLEKPKKLGKHKYSLENKHFVEYAIADTRAEYHLAEYILSIHKEYDVYPCVSIAQLSARIFKKRFIESPFILPFDKITQPALLSYHGGRNYFNGESAIYEDCTEIDIVSAYPYAMTALPCFCENTKYEITDRYIEGAIGIYKISGRVIDQKYPVIMDHDGSIIREKIEGVWVTSFELESALKNKDIIISDIFGYYIIPCEEHESPLKKFVEEFFKLKQETPKSDPRYLAYKTILNSLYGKFIQCIKFNSEDSDFIEIEEGVWKEVDNNNFVAGGLFNPIIATLITGHTRAYLHDLMHEFKAVHASTDSIKTQEDIPNERFSKGLGGITREITGDCIIFRNKLYLHYNKEGKLKKYALHGFQGTAKQLERMYLEGTKKYTVKRIQKAMASLKQISGVEPLVEIKEEREVKLSGEINNMKRVKQKGEK